MIPGKVRKTERDCLNQFAGLASHLNLRSNQGI